MAARGAPGRVVLAVCGLAMEARIAAGAGVCAIAGGGDGPRLAAAIERAIDLGAIGVISFGIAGALRPGLPTGTIVVASGVQFIAGSGAAIPGASPLPDGISDASIVRVATDERWSARLRQSIAGAVAADIAGSDGVVASASAKAEWHARTRAATVDMESHVAARIAEAHGRPFIALRAVADEADRAVPTSAVVGMRSDGRTDAFAVIGALLRRPAELPALLRAALDARTALHALARGRARLDACLNGADLDELLLHVV